MSRKGKVAKIFATMISTDNAGIRAECERQLKKIWVSDDEAYYIRDGWAHTKHGDIRYAEVKSETKPKARKKKKRVKHVPLRQEYSHGTMPNKRGWIKPTPTPPKKDWVQQLENDFSKSVIRSRNRGNF